MEVLFLYICFYVGDLIFTCNNLEMFEEFKKVTTKELEVTNIRLIFYYLGIEVKQDDNDIFTSQEIMQERFYKNFNIYELVDPTLYKSLVGNLRYMLHVTPDGATTIFMVQLRKNLIYHDQSKHIHTKFYFIRKYVENK
ncbi:hypothetical protein CR513_15877, partial [Mucuna pruriens]